MRNEIESFNQSGSSPPPTQEAGSRRIEIVGDDAHELALVRRAQAGGPDAEAAKRALLDANQQFLKARARHYCQRSDPDLLEDFVQEAKLAFLAAIDSFNETRGASVGTYARKIVAGALTAAVANYDPRPALSEHSRRRLVQYRRILRRKPKASRDEIAAELALDDMEVEALRGYDQLLLTDIDDPIAGLGDGDDDSKFGDTIPTSATLDGWSPTAEQPDVLHEVGELRVRVRHLISNELNPKQRDVIRLRYGFAGGESLTTRQVAERLHTSQSSISQNERSALAKLRDATSGPEWNDVRPHKRSTSIWPRTPSWTVPEARRDLNRVKFRFTVLDGGRGIEHDGWSTRSTNAGDQPATS